jgi:hypothetical protein
MPIYITSRQFFTLQSLLQHVDVPERMAVLLNMLLLDYRLTDGCLLNNQDEEDGATWKIIDGKRKWSNQ